ncbi:MAG: hypothetical protein A2Y14_01865 [Verrucomicrobia bacterium GWF2_51_19]|nr:MAG: hypothetical protein A2Y14_01865 [Verrucomicrobia bacterium GWF2_51_19]HCJ11896.1 hypothetical protein [Opitutae bacterium]
MHSLFNAKSNAVDADVFKEVPSDLIRLLSQIGFIALSRGLTPRAEDIFNAVTTVRPNSEEAFCAKAFFLIYSAQWKKAKDFLLPYIKEHPESDLPKAMLCVLFKLTKLHDEATDLANTIIKRNLSVDAVNIAKGILADIKSAP